MHNITRVGILTYHNANNYGAVLQAYALQQELISLGQHIDVEIINYTCIGVRKQRSLIRMIKAQGFISALLHFPFAAIRIRKIDLFCDKHMKLSPAVQDKNDLTRIVERYDIIISGSDQVWNKRWNGDDPAFLQAFHNDCRKKVSYAASFGIDQIPDDWKEEYKNCLDDFLFISVREESGAAILSALGLKGCVNIDPTLLLEKIKWDKIAITPKQSKPYAFLFMVPFQDDLLKEAVQYTQDNDLQLVTVSKSLRKIPGINANNASVEEIVGYFRNADTIITNSFHGTAFSLIFERKLLLNLNNPRGYNIRSYNLLKLCGISLGDTKSGYIRNMNCVWEQVEERIRTQKELSDKYLLEILRGKYHEYED